MPAEPSRRRFRICCEPGRHRLCIGCFPVLAGRLAGLRKEAVPGVRTHSFKACRAKTPFVIFSAVDPETDLVEYAPQSLTRAFGETPEEALREVQRAKAFWLKAAAENRKPIPSPRYRPVIYEALTA